MRCAIISVSKCGDGGWRVYFTDSSTNPPSKVKRRFQASSEEEARKKAAAIVAAHDGIWTVGTALDAYLEDAQKRVSPETMRSYEGVARRLAPLSESRIDLLYAANIEAFLHDMAQEFSSSTVKKSKNLLTAACDLAIARGCAFSNPCNDIPAVQMNKTRSAELDVESLRKLLTLMRGDYPCMIGLVMECGLTMGEVVELNQEDFAGENVTPRRRASSCGARAHTFTYADADVKQRVMPPWLCSKIAPLLDTDGYIFGKGPKAPNVEVAAKRVRGLLHDIGVDCPLSKLHAAVMRSVSA